MPDRDYLGNGKSRGWGAAVNLLATVGVRTETVTAAARALAANLRKEPAGSSLDEAMFHQGIDRVLERKLLTPARYQCLGSVGIEEFSKRERAFREAIRPDASLLFAQIKRGKVPTAPPRRRLSAKETTSLPIRTLTGSNE